MPRSIAFTIETEISFSELNINWLCTPHSLRATLPSVLHIISFFECPCIKNKLWLIAFANVKTRRIMFLGEKDEKTRIFSPFFANNSIFPNFSAKIFVIPAPQQTKSGKYAANR